MDETTARGYVMVAAHCADASVPEVRRSMRGLLLPGQASIHFRKEGDRRRRTVLSTVTRLPVKILLVRSDVPDAVTARSRCLRRLVADLPERGVTRLVLEQADGEVDRDRKSLFSAARQVDVPLTYLHLKRAADPALWVADAVGWAWTRGASGADAWATCRSRSSPETDPGKRGAREPAVRPPLGLYFIGLLPSAPPVSPPPRAPATDLPRPAP